VAPRRRYRARRLRSPYWRPGFDYVDFIVSKVKKVVENGDVLVISEKAISTASGNIIDESFFKPSLTARFLARFWMRVVWGYLLAPLCRLKPETVARLRDYPVEEGARHKEAALRVSGLLQALRAFSEGGLDVVNLPYSYAALPLRDASKIADHIRRRILKETGRSVAVVISDSDKTFSIGPIHLCSRPNPMKGLVGLGLLAYIIGASLRFKARATPVAASGWTGSMDELLDICEVADRVRGYGAGRNIWEAARRFGVGLTSISWELLGRIPHYPVVLVRRVR